MQPAHRSVAWTGWTMLERRRATCSSRWSATTRIFIATGPTWRCWAPALAVAAPLANTHADMAVRDWYQGRVRSPTTDHWSANAKIFGTYQTVIPIYLGAFAGSALLPDTPAGSVVEDWASRTLRAMAVGAPAVGIGQIGLGSGRPGIDESSHWSPGNGVHGVAGHAFVGAMPFLTAAAMTDNPWLKAPLFAASFATGWSRINDDDHYLSQVILGWWIAYLSVRSVNRTERQRPWLHFCPCTRGRPRPGHPVATLVRSACCKHCKAVASKFR